MDIAIRGKPAYSETGKWQIEATQLPSFLAPALQSVPLVLKDPEFRVRHRHADQIVHPSARDMIFLRHRLLSGLRTFLTHRNFIEVNTPLLLAGAGGAAARPFETVATEFPDLRLNLRVAPELFLKRMIVGGMQRVFELGPAFRNEGMQAHSTVSYSNADLPGVDSTHNPEFTIAEFYGVMLDLSQLMAMTEELFQLLASEAVKASKSLISVPTPELDFRSPFRTISFIPALAGAIRNQLPDWKFPDLDDSTIAKDALVKTFVQLKLDLPSNPTLPRLLDDLSGHFLEPQCKTPTFIIHQPECMAPLARSTLEHYKSESLTCRVSCRAELFINGSEYVNCYEEENSPIEQRRKFEEQIALYGNTEDDGGREVDESYIHALEWGMPPTGGWGCGFDRVVMLFGGKARIADVLPFGTLRNVVGLGSAMARRQQTFVASGRGSEPCEKGQIRKDPKHSTVSKRETTHEKRKVAGKSDKDSWEWLGKATPAQNIASGKVEEEEEKEETVAFISSPIDSSRSTSLAGGRVVDFKHFLPRSQNGEDLDTKE